MGRPLSTLLVLYIFGSKFFETTSRKFITYSMLFFISKVTKSMYNKNSGGHNLLV
jgi:hypothetical protein